MPQLEVDHRAGLPDGYVGKIECGARNYGPISLTGIMGALDVRLVLLPEAA